MEREIILALLTALNAVFLVLHGVILFFVRRELARFDRHARFNHDINNNFAGLHARASLLEMKVGLPVMPPPKALGRVADDEAGGE